MPCAYFGLGVLFAARRRNAVRCRAGRVRCGAACRTLQPPQLLSRWTARTAADGMLQQSTACCNSVQHDRLCSASEIDFNFTLRFRSCALEITVTDFDGHMRELSANAVQFGPFPPSPACAESRLG